MTRVELIYDENCPNVEATRDVLRTVHEGEWIEWNREDPVAPEYVRQFGSPTLLVDGTDVAGDTGGNGVCCRVYRSGEVVSGVPPAHLVRAALERSRNHRSPVATWLASLPTIALALLPKLACPACWPAYAGLLGAVGLGFLLNSTTLFWLTLAFLVAVLILFAVTAVRDRRLGPLLVGVAAASIILFAKFQLDSDPVTYAGVGLLVVATVWNGWPSTGSKARCRACDATVSLDDSKEE